MSAASSSSTPPFGSRLFNQSTLESMSHKTQTGIAGSTLAQSHIASGEAQHVDRCQEGAFEALRTEIAIVPCSSPLLPAFKRINSLLLPIRYPDQFYDEILSNPETASLTRVAIWRDDKQERKETAAHKRQRLDGEPANVSDSGGDGQSATLAEPDMQTSGKVVAGIRCRLEEVDPCTDCTNRGAATLCTPPAEAVVLPRRVLYIQTIGVLAAYRHMAIAAALLQHVAWAALNEYGVSEIYAHVWEKNEDALAWYARRGFDVGGDILPGFYRRLRPGGARVVKKTIRVSEALAWRRNTLIEMPSKTPVEEGREA